MLVDSLHRLRLSAERLSAALERVAPARRHSVWMVPTQRAPASWRPKLVGTFESKEAAEDVLARCNGLTEAVALDKRGRYRFAVKPA